MHPPLRIIRGVTYCCSTLQLTGITKVATELLQNYVNKTADVQTASSIMSNVLPIAYDNDARPERWAKFYRDLLDGYVRGEFLPYLSSNF